MLYLIFQKINGHVYFFAAVLLVICMKDKWTNEIKSNIIVILAEDRV